MADAPEPEVARRLRGSPNVGDCAGTELTDVMAAGADPKLNGDDVEVETVAAESCPRAWTGPQLTDVMAAGVDPQLNGEEL